MNISTIGELPQVEAALSYIEPMSDKPHSLEYEPPPGVPRTTAVHREHTVTIRDVRPIASLLSLEREGFQLVTAARSISRSRSFSDEDTLACCDASGMLWRATTCGLNNANATRSRQRQ